MKIDFYILDDASKQEALLFTCQLIEKLYLNQANVYIHTASLDYAEKLDALLWTYQDDSFIPHQLYQEADAHPPGVQIGYGQLIPKNQSSILINLHQEIPGFYQQFKHLIEIVFSDPLMQQLARERYKKYRNQGHELNTHKEKFATHDINR